MRQTVSNPTEVIENIQRFSTQLPASPSLQERLGQVHAWYALHQDGVWIFAPSKFVGYPNNTTEQYLETARKGADGRQTEKALAQWFSPLDPTSRLGQILMDELRKSLAGWGRAPRRDARISVVSGQPWSDARDRGKFDEALFSRVVSNPEVCGGRPCIRGTRMRVSDIVAMLAHGAAKSEIITDYPYLSEEDVHAALGYAARSADHRVIRAA